MARSRHELDRGLRAGRSVWTPVVDHELTVYPHAHTVVALRDDLVGAALAGCDGTAESDGEAIRADLGGRAVIDELEVEARLQPLELEVVVAGVELAPETRHPLHGVSAA